MSATPIIIGSGSNPFSNVTPGLVAPTKYVSDPATSANQLITNNLLTNLIAFTAAEDSGSTVINIGAVTQAGSTGTDYSANPAVIPMSGYVSLVIIPATPSRAYVEVQNQSAGALQMVRDDGSGGNQTSILLASGGSAGVQGGGWSSATFKGRIRLYGASGAQASAYQE